MPFKIDVRDASVVEWHATADGVDTTHVEDYTPTIYVAAADDAALDELFDGLDARGDVATLGYEPWRTAFRSDPERVLRVDVTSCDRITPVAGWIRRQKRPGTYRLFNVDFSPQFRYCLERGRIPVPDRPLAVLELDHPGPGTPTAPVTRLTIGDETVTGDSAQLLATLQRRLKTRDPDVLIVSSGEVIPALFATADEHTTEFQLGRQPGYEQLATASTYESYGQVGHSPARYNVPGRVIIDRSNTFFYSETNLEGCLDLVERSRKPLQALNRRVLVPWKSWRHEFPKTMCQLHEGDRGGFTFSPEVGVHEDVHELDFSSLYPNIICTRNISPETIRCDCHDRADVPDLEYSICDTPGYLPDVLQPIIDDRDGIKAAIDATADTAEQTALEGQSDALKWILVSCFGYQGFSNAKFGRIECHEAINAFAREILLDAKAHLEANGWRVVHGIVDSLWVTAQDDVAQQPLADVATTITDATEIRLEHEGAYDWIAFVPLRTSDAGALTKYFGRRQDGTYKYRGIESRQRSTAPFVADCQRRLIEVFDSTRDPHAVCAELASWLADLTSGAVEASELTITTQTSKARTEYEHTTRTTAALDRRDGLNLGHAPGQDVQYVVVDDSKDGRDRVRLPHEDGEAYDQAFYRQQVLRAAESVLSPLGWRQQDIEEALADRESATLSHYS
jgi:DNA polymerase I